MSLLLVDILSSFLGEPRKHNASSGQIAFDCPACSAERGMIDGDGKGNLEINYDQGIFRCWVCSDTNNMRGSVSKLLRKYATKKNISDYKLIRPDDFQSKDKPENKIIVDLPEGFKALKDCTPRDYKYNKAMDYLLKRGITEEIIRDFNIGYTTTGKRYDRIIIPSYDLNGDLNYYVARWFEDKYNKFKYLNPQAEKTTLIVNENRINWDATIYLVEGMTDHIVTPNSICLLGKFISDLLLSMLQERSMSYIVIMLDEDAYEDTIKLYKRLNFGNLRGRIRVAVPPSNEDPSSIFQKYGKRGLVQVMSSAAPLKEQCI